MSNSPLIKYTKISPNKTSPRTHKIDTITIHCYVGQASVESMGAWFAKTEAQSSCNYGIGSDGRIALIVDEADRSWCSSNKANDHRAITIECASDKTDPYAINDKVYASLINLCTDICKRNDIKELKWKADKSLIGQVDQQNMTVHRWFANKACVPTYSEVLTRNGWLPLSDVEIGDEIACADLDNLNITFEEVYDMVSVRDQDTYTNNELTATKDHRMVYSYQQSKSLYRIDEYKRLLNSGTQIYIPLAGYSNFEGLTLTDDMLRFLVAVQADGHYMYDIRKTDGIKHHYGIEFHFKKTRKIERIVEIIESIGFAYKITNQSNGTTKIRIYNQSDVNIVDDVCEKYLHNKCFTWEWLNLSPNQAALVLDEIMLWDGCKSANMYSSNEQINLDVINAIAAINGVGSRVFANNVQFRESPYITLGENTKRHNKQHNTKHTKVTCVSVKTGIFLMRQNGKTFIIGNCPGDYIYNRLGQIAKEVNAKLGSDVLEVEESYYRVRKTWADASSQKGAFTVLDNAKKCADENPGYSVFDEDGKVVYENKVKTSTGFQAKSLSGLTEAEVVSKIGSLFTEDQKKTGILASVSMAQFILESGYGNTDLAQNANNCFGMKTTLSGNTWSGSTWDGTSKYTKITKECYDGKTYVDKEADFRKYPCVEDSIRDHSAYLLGAMNGSKKRYDGLKGCTDYKKAIQIIKDGGYATDPSYVSKICNIISKWNLTQYDVATETKTETKTETTSTAKVFKPYSVKVDIPYLNIRTGAGTDYAKTGNYTGKGVFTIVEEKAGTGSKSGWGRLKSGAGWISLDYAKKV